MEMAPATRKNRLPPTQVFDVHVFLATAASKDGVAAGCRAGEVHGLLIFCRQPENEAADERLIRIERSKRLPPTAEPQDEILRAAFREALRDGFSVLAHRRQEGRGGEVRAAA